MEKQDYSAFATLHDWEEYDYDTKYWNETGINKDRAKLPLRYDIEKTVNKRRRKGYKKLFDFNKDFDWQITYNFSDEIRNPFRNGYQYGGKYVTFRRLYLILCEHFNGGRYFIEDYFSSVYPYSAVKERVDQTLADIKSEIINMFEDVDLSDAILTRKGDLAKRRKANKPYFELLDELHSFAEEWENSYSDEIASLIKEDIMNCLKTGQIPLSTHFLAESTLRQRQKAGIESEERFYATGQLIENLNLYITIGGNRKWKTQSGLTV